MHQSLCMAKKVLFSKHRTPIVFTFCVAKMKNSHDCFFCVSALKSNESRAESGTDRFT